MSEEEAYEFLMQMARGDFAMDNDMQAADWLALLGIGPFIFMILFMAWVMQ